MQIRHDQVEIESAKDIKVFGEWVQFTDSDGVKVVIDPVVVVALYTFMRENKEEFGYEVWGE